MRAILTYHSLDTSGSVISIRPEIFRQHIASIVKAGVKIVRLQEIQKADNAVAITFDDGFENFIECALPVLEHYRAPVTLFIVSGYCGKRNDWSSYPLDVVPKLNLLSWTQIRALPQSLISIGSHTFTHAPLGRVTRKRIEAESTISQEEIQHHIGRSVDSFAYPYGSVSSEARSLVRERYQIACGTTLRYLRPNDSTDELPRLDAYYFRQRTAIRLTTWRSSAYIKGRAALRYLNVVAGRTT